ncbi:hypothetical protein M2432_003570 [Mycobacterium sp. OTB74]|nr:hypothetical protein [Mycobacterium sp. OTB74]
MCANRKRRFRGVDVATGQTSSYLLTGLIRALHGDHQHPVVAEGNIDVAAVGADRHCLRLG